MPSPLRLWRGGETPPLQPLPPIALSIDVEDWFDGLGLPAHAPAVEGDVGRILAILASLDRRATFFILGDLAGRHPGLVRQIAAAGHEIACHGAGHTHLATLGPDRLAAGLREARPLLEDLSGHAVRGFRAPYFSVGPKTAWALDVIAAAGFTYDASVYPGPNDRYGWPGAPDRPVRHTPTGLVIVPVPMLHPRLPIGYSGGAYLRILPWQAVRWAALRREAPVVVYAHPWEFADTLPPGGSLRANLTRHPGRHRFEERFRAFAAAGGGRLDDLVQSREWPAWDGASTGVHPEPDPPRAQVHEPPP